MFTIYLSILLAPLCAFSEAPVNPILIEETESELQSSVESCLDTVFQEFIAKGGTIVRLDEGVTPYSIHPNDWIFPSCSGGNNRSQTLWNLLRAYSDKITLNQPHATQYGFDPFNDKANWNRKKPSLKNDEFNEWAGIDKSTKFGWDVFSAWLTKDDASKAELQMMREFYDREYFSPEVPNGIRRVYITFTINAHIHLYRLNQTNDSLKNVVVLFFPIEDVIKTPLPAWNAKPYSVQAYSALAKLIKSRLDLTLLNNNKCE